jgi:hypothetical protein
MLRQLRFTLFWDQARKARLLINSINSTCTCECHSSTSKGHSLGGIKGATDGASRLASLQGLVFVDTEEQCRAAGDTPYLLVAQTLSFANLKRW